MTGDHQNVCRWDILKTWAQKLNQFCIYALRHACTMNIIGRLAITS